MNSSSVALLGSQQPTSQSLPPVRRESALSTEALDLCRIAGLTLDPWQEVYLREALSEAPSGLWAATECGLAVPRQNGKGDLIMARQLVGLYLLGEGLGVHTAHEFRTAYEHFLRIVNVIENNPDLDGKVARIRRGAGDQAVELKTGERLRFIARSAGSGRGMSGDVVYLDEAYALTQTMMGALLPTLSARPNPQVWYTSSAARSTSLVFHSIGRRGRAGSSDRLLWAEWACDPDCDPSDRREWAKANPAYGYRISELSVQTEHDALAPEEFARERLGIPESTDGGVSIIPMELWASLAQPYEMTGWASLALDVAPDGRWASVCAVQTDSDGVAHVEVVDRRPGTDWVVGRCSDLSARFKCPIAVAVNGPAVTFLSALTLSGVDVLEVSGVDAMRAAGAFVQAVLNKQIRHLGSPALQAAITGATRRVSGDLFSWSRASSAVDITPLVAASLALANTSVPYVAAAVASTVDVPVLSRGRRRLNI